MTVPLAMTETFWGLDLHRLSLGLDRVMLSEQDPWGARSLGGSFEHQPDRALTEDT